MGVHPSQVEDAAQEVFLIVHDKLPNFEGRSKLSTWIYAIAYRVGMNYRSKAQRQPHCDDLDDVEIPLDVTPEQQLSQKEAALVVERFSQCLSEGMRDVFVLCFIEQQPPSDVAAVLGLSPNTVYSRMRLLRKGLRAALDACQLEAEEPESLELGPLEPVLAEPDPFLLRTPEPLRTVEEKS
jgi:RNA polymerase sigma-70 factor (ECF subfamily)